MAAHVHTPTARTAHPTAVATCTRDRHSVDAPTAGRMGDPHASTRTCTSSGPGPTCTTRSTVT